jgi:hypothetical protein
VRALEYLRFFLAEYAPRSATCRAHVWPFLGFSPRCHF